MKDQIEKQHLSLLKILSQKNITSSEDFLFWKQKISRQLKTQTPDNLLLEKIYNQLKNKKLIKKISFLDKKIKKRPIRSLSGVAVVSVLTKPFPCPGHCLFCPTEKNLPKSYLSGEPAVERAKTFAFNPYNQVRSRLETLEKIGHPTDKIELIVIGGSWSSLPTNYQIWFIKECFRAANDQKIRKSLPLRPQQDVLSLKREHAKNEKASHRLIGITVETRPDLINQQEILKMRDLGCTRVELGVQIIDDDILKYNRRGSTTHDLIRATKLLKNAGFKICYHLMTGLPKSTLKKDINSFKKIFSSEKYRPDMLKIYPCVVTKNSDLYSLWKNKKYRPYGDKALIELLAMLKTLIPPYVRVNRVFRDIPSNLIFAGCKISNLREKVQSCLRQTGKKCHCIRCRETKNLKFSHLSLSKIVYQASDGLEIFLSYENKKENKLAAFLRLRLPKEPTTYIEVLSQKTALIRELHTYGQLIPIGESGRASQHQGLGKLLMKEAEKISEEKGYKKIAVIAGVGVRDYYRKLGYKLGGTYMTKNI